MLFPKIAIFQDFHEEYAIEAFKKCDKDMAGFITVRDFQDIMLSIKSHLLTKEVKESLVTVSTPFLRYFYDPSGNGN